MNTKKQKEFEDVKFLVEADGFAYLQLWREWAKRSRRTEFGEIEPVHPTVEWEQVSAGFWVQIGEYKVAELGKLPICVSFCFAFLDGIKVAFYDCTSQLAIHSEIEKYLKHHFGRLKHDGGRWSHVNAQNFHNCILPITRNPEQFK